MVRRLGAALVAAFGAQDHTPRPHALDQRLALRPFRPAAVTVEVPAHPSRPSCAGWRAAHSRITAMHSDVSRI